MPWEALDSELAEMFREYTTRDEAIDEAQHKLRASVYAAIARYRARHPERYRAQRRAAYKRWAKRNPDKVRARAARYRNKHRAKHRANNTRLKRLERARNKAT